jgi:hypothetical protein
MKRIVFIILLVFSSQIFLIGQEIQLTPEILSPAGNYYNNGTINISWTIGEIAVSTLAGDNLILTQGFQQPIVAIGTSINKENFDRLIKVYPNPVQNHLNVFFPFDNLGNLTICVSDITGRRLMLNKIHTIKTGTILNIDFSQYKPGIYLLMIYSEDKEVNRFYKVRKE